MVSYEAFLLDDEINLSSQERIAKHLNGFIVTESDSKGDNASIIHSASSPLDPSLRVHIKRRRKAIKQQITRLKRIADQHFLQRKSSKHLNSILNKYPDIGEKIEEFVTTNNVGTDAWRRTGV